MSTRISSACSCRRSQFQSAQQSFRLRSEDGKGRLLPRILRAGGKRPGDFVVEQGAKLERRVLDDSLGFRDASGVVRIFDDIAGSQMALTSAWPLSRLDGPVRIRPAVAPRPGRAPAACSEPAARRASTWRRNSEGDRGPRRPQEVTRHVVVQLGVGFGARQMLSQLVTVAYQPNRRNGERDVAAG